MNNGDTDTGTSGGTDQLGLCRNHFFPESLVRISGIHSFKRLERQMEGTDGHIIGFCKSIYGGSTSVLGVGKLIRVHIQIPGGQFHIPDTGSLILSEHIFIESCGRTGQGKRPVFTVCHRYYSFAVC